MYDSILLPTDGSEATRRATEQALGLAERYDAALHVVSVVDQTVVSPDVRTDILYEELERECQQAVDDVEKEAETAGIDVTTSVLHGRPYRAVLDYLDEHDVDLVVMGTHGRRGIDRYLLGSVAEKVVRLSPVPVLTVRTSDES